MTLNEENWRTRWPSFSPREVYSPVALERYRHKLCPRAMDNLQLFREMLDTPLLVNHLSLKLRGVRTADENENIGGARDSMHVAGRAFDVTAPGLEIDKLYQAAIDSGLWGGIGRYDTFVHVDARLVESVVTTWDNRTGLYVSTK